MTLTTARFGGLVFKPKFKPKIGEKMKVLIIANTAIRGKSIAANMEKVIDLAKDDARALISAGKARVPTEADYARMSAKGGKKKAAAEKEAAEKEAAEKAAAEKAAGGQ